MFTETNMTWIRCLHMLRVRIFRKQKIICITEYSHVTRLMVRCTGKSQNINEKERKTRLPLLLQVSYNRINLLSHTHYMYVCTSVCGQEWFGHTYSIDLLNIGVQTTPEEGTRSSPMKRKPPPFPLKQRPTTLRVKPSSYSCDTMLDFPSARPRTPSV